MDMNWSSSLGLKLDWISNQEKSEILQQPSEDINRMQNTNLFQD